ncbi:MAG TPA: glycosyltransferase family 87 protein [Phototrophicaceae bacterium]|nr:glycosyltransferase family 87 protein [Phototrophicaceae bacterium]
MKKNLLFGFVVLLGAALFMINNVSQRGEAYDFIDHYNGAKAALSGISPYSESVTESNQIAWYGHVARTEDPQRFNYPAYSIFVFGVLTIFPPQAAIVIWTIIQLTLCMVMLNRLGRSAWASLLILLLLREPLSSFLLAQSTLWAAAWIGFGLIALEKRYSVRAGLCFALASLHPVLTIPLAIIVLLRDRRALLAFGISLLVGFGISLVAFGWWVPAWVNNLLNYSSGVNYLVWVARQFPVFIPVGGILLLVGVTRKAVWSRFSFTLSAFVLLLPLTGLYHLTLFLPMVAKMRWRWLAILTVIMWALAPQPFAIRQWEPVILAALVLAYEFWITLIVPQKVTFPDVLRSIRHPLTTMKYLTSRLRRELASTAIELE